MFRIITRLVCGEGSAIGIEVSVAMVLQYLLEFCQLLVGYGYRFRLV